MLARIIESLTSREALLALALGALTALATPGFGQTTVLSAVTDFPSIDTGDAPYYPEASRGSLAINAANVSYRNVFAKATTEFGDDTGLYDLTLIGLAELDGEAQYRVSVNGELIGEANNPPSSVDYLPIAHHFRNVSLNTGDTLAVESLANSNDTIPEGDGFAFARGRWTELRLTPAGEIDSQPEKVSLIGTAASVLTDITVGDTVDIIFAATNEDGDWSTATNVRMLFDAPSEMSFADGHDCTLLPTSHAGSRRASCAMQQLAPGESATGELTLVADTAIESVIVHATIIANQQDADGADNRVNIAFSISEEEEDSEILTETGTEDDTETNLSTDNGTEELSSENSDESTAEATSAPTPVPAVETPIDSNDENDSDVTNKPIPANPFESVKDEDETIDNSDVATGALGLGSMLTLWIFLLAGIRRKDMS